MAADEHSTSTPPRSDGEGHPTAPEERWRLVVFSTLDEDGRLVGEQHPTLGHFDGLYEASNLGRVRSRPCVVVDRRGQVRVMPGRLLRHRPRSDGYRAVRLSVRARAQTVSVHRLVAYAFLGPPPSGKHGVAHWDGDPANNRVENLRWATPVENESDKLRHGTAVMRVPEEAVAAFLRSDEPAASWARRVGITGSAAAKMRRGTRRQSVSGPRSGPHGYRYGEASPNAKLTAEQARDIIERRVSLAEAAKKFGINRDTARDIRRGRAWKHLHRRAD